jgi:hypothetical protein
MTLTHSSLLLRCPSTSLGNEVTQLDQLALRFIFDVSNGYCNGHVFTLSMQQFRTANFCEGLKPLGNDATNELTAGLANKVPHAPFE